MSNLYSDPLSELDLICFTLRTSANENWTELVTRYDSDTRQRDILLGEMLAYDKVREKIKELKERRT